ncbi:tyrosine-type recombinase/integrase [Aquibacillus albus]|uniref:Integrase/recombinase XerD n=1 Tax=Aquibacillus albus TaxID=1168171 RepID=A0ABS2N501_9BACI|nr:tyrosine-type recombinase/integrase [Aquibacillus albus]MBM7573232.1 integrase/recombinase XerD [Aquibacillus albus]
MRKLERKGIRKTARTPKTETNNVIKRQTLKDMFQRFMIDKRTEALTQTTIDDYDRHFGYLLDFLGGDLTQKEITTDVFREYIGYMLHTKNLSPVTTNVRIRTIRAFLRHCFEHGWINEQIHEFFKPVKTGEIKIEAFTPEEINVLLEQIDETRYMGFRNKVMILTLLDTMVRISELIKIRRKNVDLKTGHIQLEPHETKMKRYRVVPLSNKSIRLLSEYMEETEDFEAETLFLTYDGRPINANTFRKNLVEYKEAAGINKRVSPHIFRHTGALFYIMNGGDPFSLQDILGHTDMSMVRRYIKMTNVHIKRQHNTFSPLKNLSR